MQLHFTVSQVTVHGILCIIICPIKTLCCPGFSELESVWNISFSGSITSFSMMEPNEAAASHRLYRTSLKSPCFKEQSKYL